MSKVTDGKTKTSGARAKKNGKMGAGWGGPAKGAHPNKPRYVFGKPGPGRGHFTIAGEQRMEREARQAEEMRELLYGFATDDGREDPIRIQAATKLLDRIEGLPVQKVVTQQADALSRMTDQQLEEAAAETERRLATHEALKQQSP